MLEVSPDLLTPNLWNVNVVSPENEAKLEASLGEFGLFKPIVVREIGGGGYEILGGEHRWLAAKRLKLKVVPIANLGPIDDDQAKKVSLVDNARFGADDNIALGELLRSLTDAEHLTDIMPFSEADLRSVFSSTIALDELDELDLDDSSKENDEEEAPVTPREAKTHTMMRFKVTLADAERITEIIANTKKLHDFTSADDLTNAGDALVHLLNLADSAE